MSAFVVSKHTIDAIVTAWIRLGYDYLERGERRGRADAVGAMLWAENVRSVNKRYSEEKTAPAYAFEEVPLPRVFTDALPPLFRLLDCWEYQTCETDDHASTEAWRWVEELRKAAVAELPGYLGCTVWDAHDRDVLCVP